MNAEPKELCQTAGTGRGGSSLAPTGCTAGSLSAGWNATHVQRGEHGHRCNRFAGDGLRYTQRDRLIGATNPGRHTPGPPTLGVMPVTTIDSTGADATWRVREACVWRTACQLLDGTTPVDVSAATIAARITASPTSTTALKTFTVTITNGPNGEWEIEIPDTAADLAVGTYWWAMEIDVGVGDEPLVSGRFIVEPWVIVP